MIIVQAEEPQLIRLKEILQSFSFATGLHINYEKSTFLPIHVSPDTAAALASSFGCSVSSFPQPYLGLPLSNLKLHLSNFLPIICRHDKYLAGWKGPLLNEMARTTLATSVLTSLLVYAMSKMTLLEGTIHAMDRRTRAFIWTSEGTCNGGNCKVAWEDVQKPKNNGGLGIKDLAKQKKCLLHVIP